MCLATLVALAILVFATEASACTTVIVGKSASATGSCLVAHTEDDYIEDATIVEAVPAATHAPGSAYELFYGGNVPLPARTEGYIGTKVYDKSLIPGDMTGLINDHQVTIFNNWAPGRYDPRHCYVLLWSEFTELAGLQATTAREAVEIIGHLVETHGAKWGGTMYAVADPNEAWWVEICGRQWVAERVADGRAEMRANRFRIGVVDFSRPTKFLWSPDIVSYAEKRGWYRRADGPFNWRKAYSMPGTTAIDNYSSTVRHKMVGRYLARYLARGPITKQQLMRILRGRYEGSRYFNLRARPYTICNEWTINASVAELRGSLPAGIGGVLWTTLSQPSANGFIPWYEGVTAVPDEYASGSYRWKPGSAYWACRRLAKWVSQRYRARTRVVTRAWSTFERQLFDRQAEIEVTALQMHATDPAEAWAYLTAYSGTRAHEAYLLAQQLRHR